MSAKILIVVSLVSNLLALMLPLALIQVYDRIIANQSIGTATFLFLFVGLAIYLDGFAMGSNGHWVYTADNDHQDIQKLNTGQSLTESITVHSADGTAHDITFTIHGTDEISLAPPPDHNQSDEGDMSELNPRITVEVRECS